MTVTLTETEARVLYNALYSTWAPRHGYTEFLSAVKKLCVIGRGFICRDCTGLGVSPSRFGGWCCREHKIAEDALITQEKP